MALINRAPNRAVIDALDIQPDDRMLEIGCGPGDAVRMALSCAPSGHIYGLDRSAVMIGQARRRNARASAAGRADFVVASFDQVPLPDGQLDKVLGINVVYFWDNAGAVLDELHRLLCPGGILALYATSRSTMANWKFARADTHRLFDAAELAAILKESPFAADRISVTPVALPLGIKGLVALAQTSARL